MKLDLTQFDMMPIGKYKNSPIGDIGRNDSGYLHWAQINTIYDFTDFEAITGLQKPIKSEEAAHKRVNYTQTASQQGAAQPKAAWTPQGSTNQPPRSNYTPPVPHPMKISSVMKNTVPEDFTDLERADFVYLIHVLSKSYRSKFNRALLEDALRIDARTEKEVVTEREKGLSPAAQEIKSAINEDDLPFNEVD